jgi:ribonuclease Y
MALALAAAIAALIGAVAMALAGGRRARARIDAAKAAARGEIAAAERVAAAKRRQRETEARRIALELRTTAELEVTRADEAVAEREGRVAAAESGLAASAREQAERATALAERQAAIEAIERRARAAAAEVDPRGEVRRRLEELAGERGETIRDRLAASWIEDARAEAAQVVRQIEGNAADPDIAREAKRLLDIATSRYRGHFLTERAISNVPLAPGLAELLSADDRQLLLGIQEGAGVQLHLSDTGHAVRLEGLDGVGREVARRALARLGKKPESIVEARREPAAWTRRIRATLDQEIVGLGKKAFQVLEIERPHPEIVTLVGRLNYRTSYTQNQWLHAVEASFLAGMMAAEMGLDVRLTRRATLMHDIGKALTHEQGGSHAVIGADIARRLGEAEIVANAIGAHHADEPPGSIYAFLVAASDALSGARPGARREHTEGYSNRLGDLERIGASYRGVERAFAVHGGRELRVYVHDREVDDLGAVELSSEIAARISEEMTFPGQIKVTVIRSTEAVAVAS